MPDTVQGSGDVSIHGCETRLRGVQAAGVARRPWLATFPVCPLLNQHYIAHVGLMEAFAPYEILRSNQSSTYFMACYRGQGLVLIDGRWRVCGAGMACLLPAHILNAFRAVPGVKWEFCWVCYVQPAGQRQISNSASPVLARYDHVPLHSAILGLIHECRSPATPVILQRWVDLINHYVLRFAKPSARDTRLPNLWERVTAQLNQNWTLGRLAREAGYSSEHLRRLCHLEVGRSPMHQVIYLRMRRAAEMLSATGEKVEAIAQAVGYENPFVFSKAFHKRVGWRPSEYRGNRVASIAPAKPARQPKRTGNHSRQLLSLLGLLTSLLSAFCAEERSLPPTDQESLSPAAARGAPSAGRSTPQTNAATSETEKQDRALREEQLSAARELCARLPHNSDAIYVTGYVSNEQGDSASAIRHWEEMIRPDAQKARLYDQTDAFYNLGYTYLLREDHQKAIHYLRESVRLNPRRQETHYRLAHALFLQGAMEECIRALDEGKVATALAHRLRGQANQQLGKLQDAKRNYESAVQLNPDLAEAYYGLATVCARIGDTTKADEHRRKFDTLKSQGQVAGRQARTDFDPLAITRRSLASTHTEVARVYMAHGHTQEAEKLLLRAAEVDPANTACRFQLVLLYQQAKRNQDALRFSKEMVRAEPRNPFHYLATGNLHARLKQNAEAEAAFKKVIELAPDRPEGYFALAQFYLQANPRPAEALALARRAVSLAPSPVNYYVLSQACAINGDMPAAIAAIEKACALDPGNNQYQEWRSLFLKQQ